MHTVRFVNRWLERKCSFMHQVRARSLSRTVDGLLRGGKLSLTHLGRSLVAGCYEKHRIKSVDRLLGNPHLHAERIEVYAALAREMLLATPTPVLVVDWADGHEGRQWLLLRASVAVQGRALTVYEEAHPKHALGSASVEGAFLRSLKSVLPSGCTPVVVTDAGFRGRWFYQVEANGWRWIGRVRGRVYCRRSTTGLWAQAKTLHREATSRAKAFTDSVLYKFRPLACDLYLVKKYQRARGAPRKRRGLGALARKSRRSYAQPWLLAASPDLRALGAKTVVAMYTKRMTIEESFRDLKSHRWGFAARYARSRNMQRIQVLLLIACLACFVTWLAGMVAMARQWSARFQANTERHRPVLSIGFIGWRILKLPDVLLLPGEWHHAIARLRILVQHHACPL